MGQTFGAPQSIAELLREFDRPWAFCGGWAIDLFLNRATRPHKDVDVAVFRKDQHAIRSYLLARGWAMEKAVDGQLLPWEEEEFIQLPVHVIWCRKPAGDPDFLELLFNETDGHKLLFRRDQSITLPLDRALLRSDPGQPILAPELVLLYKSNDAASEGNASDFACVLPYLEVDRRAWLAGAMRKLYGDHPWLQRL